MAVVRFPRFKDVVSAVERNQGALINGEHVILGYDMLGKEASSVFDSFEEGAFFRSNSIKIHAVLTRDTVTALANAPALVNLYM